LNSIHTFSYNFFVKEVKKIEQKSSETTVDKEFKATKINLPSEKCFSKRIFFICQKNPKLTLFQCITAAVKNIGFFVLFIGVLRKEIFLIKKKIVKFYNKQNNFFCFL
jgi:hypothetical protein